MKKTQNIFYIFLLLLLFSNYSYSQETFHITSFSVDNGPITKEKYSLVYDSEMNSIGIIDFNSENRAKVSEYGPVELKNTTYEQGLYIEEYHPTIKKLLDKPATEKLHIFKFAYDKKGGKPVMVVEVSGLSKFKNFQVKYYYTDYYFDLKDRR